MKRMSLSSRCCSGIALTVLALGATAQTPSSRPGVVNVDIRSQPIGAALNELAQQAGIQVLFFADATNDLKDSVPALAGMFTADEALLKLLANTGLTFSYVNERTVAVHRVANTASGATTTRIETAPPVIRLASDLKISEKGSNEIAEETGSPAGGGNPREESRNTRLEEVIVTAQGREERLRDVPMSISVMSGAALDSAPPQDLSDALSSVPSVAMSSTYLGGGSNIAIRGVGTSFPLWAGQSAVAYYLDSAPFGLVKSAIGPDANVYDLERVEVLRGPQGTLYGASALNGVIRILTREPDLDEFDFKWRASTFSTDQGSQSYGGDASINVPLAPGRFALRATAGYHDNGGWIDQVNREDANDSKNQNYRIRLLGRLTDHLTVGLDAWSARFESGAPDQGASWDQSLSAVDQPISSSYDTLALRLGYDGPGFTISSVTSKLKYENVGRLGLDVPSFNIPGEIYYSLTESEVTSEEININSTGRGPWRWSIGGMYREGTEDLFQTFRPVVLAQDIKYYDTSESFAIYGQVTRLLFDDRLELSAGLRYFDDEISQRGQTAPSNPFTTASSEATATTPRVTATWHLDPRSIIYASYSEGFRSGFPQTPAVLAAFPAFPAAQPDRLRNYEIGVRGVLFGGGVSYDIAAYHLQWEDIQLRLGVQINNLPYVGIVNGAEAKGNGVDFSLTFQPTNGLTISPYVSWNDLHVSEDVFSGSTLLYAAGDRPANSAEVSAGLSAEYSFSAGSLPITLSGSANYLSSQAYRSLSGSNLLVQEGDDLLSTRASIGLDVTDNLTLTLFGNNLTNEHGVTAIMFSGTVPNWEGHIRPMTVGIQLEYRMH